MNDLISRRAAITIPVTPKEDREYQTYNLDDAYEQAWEDLQKRIEQLPSVQSVVKKGHWIFNPKDAIEMMFTLPKCSECGAESSDGGNYCSNCGAKMDNKEKENEGNV